MVYECAIWIIVQWMVNMAKTYVSISNEDIFAFLKGWNYQHKKHQMDLRRTSGELELWIPLGSDLNPDDLPDRIIVYTSLFMGKSRPVGLDAIRIRAFFNGRWYGKNHRINRVEGWQKRLAEKLDWFIGEWQMVHVSNLALDEITTICQEMGLYDTTHNPLVKDMVTDIERCLYCGSVEVNASLPGIGAVCSHHQGYENGQWVMLVSEHMNKPVPGEGWMP